MTLPILAYRDTIIDAVNEHAVTVIKAETGSGKSTQVPQFLMHCADNVVVTQPRRLAAIELGEKLIRRDGGTDQLARNRLFIAFDRIKPGFDRYSRARHSAHPRLRRREASCGPDHAARLALSILGLLVRGGRREAGC